MKQAEHWIVSQIIHLVHNKLFREANISCPLMCAYQGVGKFWVRNKWMTPSTIRFYHTNSKNVF